MLLLDADADPEILGALEIDLQRTTNMVLRPNAEVVQVHDRRMIGRSKRLFIWAVLRLVLGFALLAGAAERVEHNIVADGRAAFSHCEESSMSVLEVETRTRDPLIES